VSQDMDPGCLRTWIRGDSGHGSGSPGHPFPRVVRPMGLDPIYTRRGFDPWIAPDPPRSSRL